MKLSAVKSKIQEITGLSSGQLHGYGSIVLMVFLSYVWLAIDMTEYVNATIVGLASLLGFASTILIGILVEFIDYKEYGLFDKGDLISDFVGAGIGLAIFWISTSFLGY